MLARYYLKRRDVSELLLNFDYFIIAEVIAPMKYCCYYGHQCVVTGYHISCQPVDVDRVVDEGRVSQGCSGQRVCVRT